VARPNSKLTFLIPFLALALLLSACAAPSQPTQDVQPLRVALLPVLDTLPFYIAAENGYFEDEGVQVEAVPVASPVERDQLMQAGEIDGMLTEPGTVALFNQQDSLLMIVLTARAATDTGPVFRVLAAPNSDITTPSDLAGVPIGVSQNTIIEYVTERMLTESGVAPDQIITESVPVIPERFQLLMQGELQAATLPDPLAQAALQAGAKLVVEDSQYPMYSVSVMAFTQDTIQNNGEAVRRFVAAWDKAVADLNAAPEAYRTLFLEKVNVPESVQDTYQIPAFPRGEVPSEALWADVLTWLKDKGLVEADVVYSSSVTPEFLPR